MSLLLKLYSNQEFLTVLGAVALAAVLTSILNLPDILDPLMVFTVLAGGFYLGWKFFARSVENPLLSYLALQLLFLWMGLDQLLLAKMGLHAKPHVLAVGLGTLATLVYMFRDFRYYWGFPLFRCTLIFFSFSLLYYFGYSSDFTISSVSAGYPLGSGLVSEFNEANAKSIVFLGSLSALIATTCGLSVFKGVLPNQIRARLLQIVQILIGAVLLYLLLSLADGFKTPVPGNGVVLPMLFFMLLGFTVWISRKVPETRLYGIKLLSLLPPLLVLNFVCLFLAMNKTTLIGFSFCLLVFALLNQSHGFKINYWALIHEKLDTPFKKITFLSLLLVGGIVVLASGVLEVFSDKIAYFSKGFSTLSTLQVRTGNWYYFTEEWMDTLNPFRLLFGYGLGASRQTIFYISAMRQAGSVTLVQTLHDSYLEFFYDYGLVALIYYFGLLATWRNSLKCLLTSSLPDTLRGFSLLSFILLLDIAIYAIMDGIRVPIVILLFSALGMIEGLRVAITAHSSRSLAVEAGL